MIRWKLLNSHYLIWTIIYISVFMQRLNCLTVDNQLVSARNDCFERIALEAMMPFEKTFKTEDTNSLRMCKEKCLQEGDKCQSISFGVHRRGNGTCQLSKEKYKTGSRPNGVIFDPDFDLYARKTNCFDLGDNNVEGQADNLAETNGYGTSFAPTTPMLLPSRPSEGTPILIVDPTPTVITTLQEDNTHYPSPTSGYGDTTIYTQGPSPTTLVPSPQNIPPSSSNNGDRLYFSQDIYPLYKYPMLYEPNYPAPNQDVYIPGGYAANAQEVGDRYRPASSYDDSTRPSPPPNYNGPPRPMFGLGYGSGYGYGKPESYSPSTMRPQDSNYNSNSQRPDMNRDRDPMRPPGYDNNNNRDPTRPYGNDYNNRDPIRPNGYDNNNRDQIRPNGYDNTTPSSTYYPRPENTHSSSSPYGPPRPGNDHSSSSTSYGPPRPGNDFSSPEPYGSSRPSSPAPYGPSRPSSQRPGDFMDFTNRPDAPDGTAKPSTYGPQGGNSNNNYDNNYMRRNGTAVSRPDDDKKINTYFNPDDYLPGNKKRPGSYEDDERLDYNRGPMKVSQPLKLECGNNNILIAEVNTFRSVCVSMAILQRNKETIVLEDNLDILKEQQNLDDRE